MRIKIGDNVKCVKEYGDRKYLIGHMGTVIDETISVYLVKFEEVAGNQCFAFGKNAKCLEIVD